MVAPVAGSGSWPAWMARVEKPTSCSGIGGSVGGSGRLVGLGVVRVVGTRPLEPEQAEDQAGQPECAEQRDGHQIGIEVEVVAHRQPIPVKRRVSMYDLSTSSGMHPSRRM